MIGNIFGEDWIGDFWGLAFYVYQATNWMTFEPYMVLGVYFVRGKRREAWRLRSGGVDIGSCPSLGFSFLQVH
jgi:hypothetical protein